MHAYFGHTSQWHHSSETAASGQMELQRPAEASHTRGAQPVTREGQLSAGTATARQDRLRSDRPARGASTSTRGQPAGLPVPDSRRRGATERARQGTRLATTPGPIEALGQDRQGPRRKRLWGRRGGSGCGGALSPICLGMSCVLFEVPHGNWAWPAGCRLSARLAAGAAVREASSGFLSPLLTSPTAASSSRLRARPRSLLRMRHWGCPAPATQPASQAARQPARQLGRQPGRQAGRQAGRQPGRQAARQPGSQRGSQAARQPGSQAARQTASHIKSRTKLRTSSGSGRVAVHRKAAPRGRHRHGQTGGRHLGNGERLERERDGG